MKQAGPLPRLRRQQHALRRRVGTDNSASEENSKALYSFHSQDISLYFADAS
jgi:hypothetical protein